MVWELSRPQRYRALLALDEEGYYEERGSKE